MAGTGYAWSEDSCGFEDATLGTIDVWLANGRSSFLEHDTEDLDERAPGLLDLDGDGRLDVLFPAGSVAFAEDCPG